MDQSSSRIYSITDHQSRSDFQSIFASIGICIDHRNAFNALLDRKTYLNSIALMDYTFQLALMTAANVLTTVAMVTAMLPAIMLLATSSFDCCCKYRA